MSLSKNLLIRSRRRCYWCKNYTCTCILQIDQHSNVNITQDFFPIRLISYYSRLCWRPILATAVWDINTRRRHVIVKKSVCKQLSQSILVQKLCILHSAQLQTNLDSSAQQYEYYSCFFLCLFTCPWANGIIVMPYKFIQPFTRENIFIESYQ